METKEANHTITGDGYQIKKLNNNLYSVINKEINIDIEVKIEEEDFETDLINQNPETENYEAKELESEELYQNHVIKQELVIGPEEIQENIPLHIYKESNQAETYQCIKCKESFKMKQTLNIHLKDVHAIKLCQYCHKSFNKTSNVKRHENYSCSYNESVVKNNKLLKYGMFTHPFICDICKKSYTHKNTLRNHIKSHAGMGIRKTYKCNLCDKSYTKSHNLTCHMQSAHLKIKPYLCRYCKKRFSWRFSLTSHVKSQHSNIV